MTAPDHVLPLAEAAAALAAAALGPAAIGHLADRRAYASAIEAYGLVPARAAPGLAGFLPVAMLTSAGAALTPASRAPGLAAAAGLFALFALAVTINLLRGRALACGCTPWADEAPITAGLALRNLAAAAAFGAAAFLDSAWPPITAAVLCAPLLTATAGQAALTHLRKTARLA